MLPLSSRWQASTWPFIAHLWCGSGASEEVLLPVATPPAAAEEEPEAPTATAAGAEPKAAEPEPLLVVAAPRPKACPAHGPSQARDRVVSGS